MVGIEIDTEAAEKARQFCARVLSLDLNRPGWSNAVGEQFDLVTYGDVLEHLLEPRPFSVKPETSWRRVAAYSFPFPTLPSGPYA